MKLTFSSFHFKKFQSVKFAKNKKLISNRFITFPFLIHKDCRTGKLGSEKHRNRVDPIAANIHRTRVKRISNDQQQLIIQREHHHSQRGSGRIGRNIRHSRAVYQYSTASLRKKEAHTQTGSSLLQPQ